MYLKTTIIQWNLSTLNLLRTSYCVHNRQVFDLSIAIILIWILFKVCFIQNSVLFRIRFGTFFQYIHIVYQYLIDINSVFIDFTEYYRKWWIYLCTMWATFQLYHGKNNPKLSQLKLFYLLACFFLTQKPSHYFNSIFLILCV